MTPKEILGRGFKGAASYYLHDKGKKDTSERVEWTHTENLPTNDPNAAWKMMIWTAEHASDLKRANSGRIAPEDEKVEQPVYVIILPWHKDDNPTKEEMISAGRGALESVGLQEHEALFIPHNDTEHPHVNILTNLIHPKTGVGANLWRSQRKLSKWASDYERKKGVIRCPQREENRRKRENGQKNVRYHDTVIQNAWSNSDSAQGFQAALAEQGYILARGNRGRYIVVHHKYKTVNPAKHIENVNAQKFKAHMKVGLNYDLLPDEAEAKKLSQKFYQKEKQRPQQQKQPPTPTIDRDQQNADWEQSIIDGAIAKEQSKDARKEFDECVQRGAEVQKRQALEEWGQRLRGRRENMQVEECADLIAKHERQIKQERQRHKDYYGAYRKRARQELAAIKERQNQTGMQRFIYRLSGKSAEDKFHETRLKLNINKANQLQQKDLQTLQTNQQQERQEMENRHTQQRKNDEIRIIKRIKSGELPERTKIRQAANQNQQIHQQDQDYALER